MTELLEIVPFALTIAISPIPLAGMLMMFVSPTGLRTSTLFVVGWTVGIAFALTALALLASLIPFSAGLSERETASVLPLVIGVFLLLIGLVLWWRGERSSEINPVTPRWLAYFETLTPIRAAVFGFVYAAFKPKNLAMTLTAGFLIQQSGENATTVAIRVGAFTLIASLGLTLPLVLFLAGGKKIRQALIAFRLFIVKHMTRITGGTFIILGLVLGLVSGIQLMVPGIHGS